MRKPGSRIYYLMTTKETKDKNEENIEKNKAEKAVAVESAKSEEAVKSPEKSEIVDGAEGSTKSEEKPVVKKKKKIRRQILKGQAHVQCTYNNTIVTLSDLSGKTLAWCSAGSLGFKGAKKATPYAATQIVNTVSEKVSKYGLREVEVYVKGVGSGREASIRALANNNFEITSIKDITPVPHNGCRPKKPRRV
jgi:small subunit ribosomal protein S11